MEDNIRYLIEVMRELVAKRKAAPRDPYYEGFTDGLEHGLHLVQATLLARVIDKKD